MIHAVREIASRCRRDSVKRTVNTLESRRMRVTRDRSVYDRDDRVTARTSRFSL